MHVNYVGSGPSCYANSFAMMFGDAAPSVAVIEFATSSPFGMQLIGGKLPLFDPYGWDPNKVSTTRSTRWAGHPRSPAAARPTTRLPG